MGLPIATGTRLDTSLPDLATLLESAGYDVVHKGKWHMSNGTRGADDTYNHDDISRYGFDGWNPPDGGMLWPTRPRGGHPRPICLTEIIR